MFTCFVCIFVPQIILTQKIKHNEKIFICIYCIVFLYDILW